MNGPFSLKPLAARIASRVLRSDLASIAVDRRELSPGMSRIRPPAISLPGEFEKASGFFMPREFERQRIAGGLRQEGATIAYAIDDALMAGGAVYAGVTFDAYRPEAARFVLRGVAEQRGESLLATSKCAELYFGDWLIEHFSLALIARRSGLEGVCFSSPTWFHEAGYREMLGAAKNPVTYARFERLWMIDDRGQNASRADRLRELRHRIRSAASPTQNPAKVFLARGALGKAREIVNQAEVEQFLIQRGFCLIRPEQEHPKHLAGLLKAARIVLCVEGSAQMHAILAMPDGGTLANIQPPERLTALGKDLADLVGLKYGFLVGDTKEAGAFSVSIDRLAATIDLIEAQT